MSFFEQNLIGVYCNWLYDLTLSLLLGLPCPGTVFLYPSGTVVSKNALLSLFSVFFKQFVIVAGKKHAL